MVTTVDTGATVAPPLRHVTEDDYGVSTFPDAPANEKGLQAEPDQHVTDGWLTLAEAAAHLEISLDAMRRRMRRGDFPRRQVRTRHGVTWQVRLSPMGDSAGDAGATLATTLVPTVAIEPTVQALLAYLRDRDRQRDAEVAQLREELAAARADLVDHAGQLAEAREQMRALQAPAGELFTEGERSANVLAAELTEAERQELHVLRAEHEVRLQTWDKPRATVALPWWRRLFA
jgi:hypothetical protein